MRTQRCVCRVCGKEYIYEHGGDKGYATDLCSPFCEGREIGSRERDASDAAAMPTHADLMRQVETLRNFAREISEWTMHSGVDGYDKCREYREQFYLMESEIGEARGLARAALAATAPAKETT